MDQEIAPVPCTYAIRPPHRSDTGLNQFVISSQSGSLVLRIDWDGTDRSTDEMHVVLPQMYGIFINALVEGNAKQLANEVEMELRRLVGDK